MLEGTYRLQVIPSISGFEEKWVENIEVKAGQIVEKQVELTATEIRVELISEGQPYSAKETAVALYKHDPDARSIESEEWVCYLDQVEKGVFEAKVKEGVYDFHIYNLGEGIRDRSVRRLEVVGGQTLEKVIELGGFSKIRFKVTWNDEAPTEEELRLMLYYSDDEEYVCDPEMIRPGVFEAKLAEGVYDLEISDGGDSQWVEEFEVSGGQTLEMEIEVTLEKW